MDYAHMPARALLAELAVQAERRTVAAGIPAEHVVRAIKQITKYLDDGPNTPWTPFKRAYVGDHGGNNPAYVAGLASMTGIAPGAVKAQIDDLNKDEYWVNDRYQVAKRHFGGDPKVPAVVCLSIKRLDQKAVHDWRDFMRIKDELVGPEYEGVELYPAQSRLVDTANQYFLWVVDDKTFRFPFGFMQRLVIDGDPNGPAVQRPLPDDWVRGRANDT